MQYTLIRLEDSSDTRLELLYIYIERKKEMKKKGKTLTIIDDIPAVIDGSSSRRNKKRVFQGLLLVGWLSAR